MDGFPLPGKCTECAMRDAADLGILRSAHQSML
jgi:hypothetical protein